MRILRVDHAHYESCLWDHAIKQVASRREAPQLKPIRYRRLPQLRHQDRRWNQRYRESKPLPAPWPHPETVCRGRLENISSHFCTIIVIYGHYVSIVMRYFVHTNIGWQIFLNKKWEIIFLNSTLLRGSFEKFSWKLLNFLRKDLKKILNPEQKLKNEISIFYSQSKAVNVLKKFFVLKFNKNVLGTKLNKILMYYKLILSNLFSIKKKIWFWKD